MSALKMRGLYHNDGALLVLATTIHYLVSKKMEQEKSDIIGV